VRDLIPRLHLVVTPPSLPTMTFSMVATVMHNVVSTRHSDMAACGQVHLRNVVSHFAPPSSLMNKLTSQP